MSPASWEAPRGQMCRTKTRMSKKEDKEEERMGRGRERGKPGILPDLTVLANYFLAPRSAFFKQFLLSPGFQSSKPELSESIPCFPHVSVMGFTKYVIKSHHYNKLQKLA
jgi:hypothetical protein